MKDLATYIEYLGVKSSLSTGERSMVLGAIHAVKDHLVRETKDASTGTGKWTPKELLGEAERVLLRANSGLSLLERLRRDAKLRDEFSKLLYSMSSDPEAKKEQLTNKYAKHKQPKRGASGSPSGGASGGASGQQMRDVPIS